MRCFGLFQSFMVSSLHLIRSSVRCAPMTTRSLNSGELWESRFKTQSNDLLQLLDCLKWEHTPACACMCRMHAYRLENDKTQLFCQGFFTLVPAMESLNTTPIWYTLLLVYHDTRDARFPRRSLSFLLADRLHSGTVKKWFLYSAPVNVSLVEAISWS